METKDTHSKQDPFGAIKVAEFSPWAAIPATNERVDAKPIAPKTSEIK